MLSKTDANQQAIIDTLRNLGFFVQDLHKVGRNFPDILVMGQKLPEGKTTALLVEIKTENGKLSEGQKVWFFDLKGKFPDAPAIVARDFQEILEWFGR